MKEIFEISKESVEKQADDYIKNLKYEVTDEEKAHIKEMYVANGLKQLEKMKRAYDLEYRKVQKNRTKAKQSRKDNLKRIRRQK